MRTLSFILLMFIVPLNLFAQRITVTDQAGQPIENVVVTGSNFSTHTLNDGTLHFFPESGTLKATFIHPNYKRVTLTWEEMVTLNFNIKLDERNRQLEEVVIRPLKRAQTLSDIPQKVLTLNAADVQLFQPQTSADLLGNSGEVFIQKSQMGGGSPMIRGFSANRILLVVDGVRLNNAIYRSGNLHNVISIDALSIDQTEIILGPGSVIYGSDALGGVIHFYTLKPKLGTMGNSNPLNAMVRYSSANFEKTASINYNIGGEKWAAVSSLTFSDFDDLTMGTRRNEAYTQLHYVKTENGTDVTVPNPNPNRQTYSAYSQLNAIQKIRYRPNDNADLEYAFHFSRTGDIPRYDRLIEYTGDNLRFAEWYYGPQQLMLHSLKAELATEKSFMDDLTIQAAYQDFTESRHDRRFGRPTRNSREDNANIFSLNIDADKFFSRTQAIFYGLEGVYNYINSEGFATNIQNGEKSEIAPRYPNGSQWWSLAAYIMYNQMISPMLNIQAGARYNYAGMSGTFDNRYYNFPFEGFNNSDGATTASFGMVFTPNDQIRINFNAGSGFRSPNIDDAAKVFDSEPGNVVVPNPNLSPEYASSVDGGLKWEPSQDFSVGLTLFYTRLFNAMVRRDGQLNGHDSIMYDGQMSKVRTIANTSWANIGGLSFSYFYTPLRFMVLKGNVNWQTGTDDEGLPVRHVAPAFGDLHFILKKKRIQLDNYVVINGAVPFEKLAADEREKPLLYAVDNNGLPYSPSWWTLNCKINYSISDKISLGGGIENILNVRYRPYSSGIVAPGINMIFSVNFKL
jgi:hemoglobin/transferrin/lactoferrin receptor protein